MTTTALTSLLSNTWGLLLVVLFFCGAIFFHELGHFLAAKWRGLKIDRFSIGFGPRIFGWRGKDGVDYRISLLPLGGYVALPQLADMRAIEGESSVPEGQLPPISYADKMIVAAAGPAFNVALALALACVVWVFGYPAPAETRSTQIGHVHPTINLDSETTVASPASKAGLEPGDRILAVDGSPVKSWLDIQKFIITGSGRDEYGNPLVTLDIERNGIPKEIRVLPELVQINARSGKEIRNIGIQSAYTLNIAAVSEHSPAALAGLQPGDIVNTVNGQPVYSIPSLNALTTRHPDREMRLGITRDGKAMEIRVTPRTIPYTKPLLRLSDATNPTRNWEFIPTPEDALDFDSQAPIIVFKAPGQERSSPLGWQVEALNGTPVTSLESLATLFESEGNNTLTLSRAGDKREVPLTPDLELSKVPPATRALLGFNIDAGTVIAHPDPITQIREQVEMTLLVLGSLLSPKSDIGLNQLSGPVGIGRVLHAFSLEDLRLAIWFAVLLNINLAILNLLPIPVLDGGHMVFATISKLIGKKLPINFIAATQGTFMLLLFGLMFYILVYDSLDWIGDREAEQRNRNESAYYVPFHFTQDQQ